MMNEEGTYTVGMLELDRNLSKVAKRARETAVLVTHRNKPWLCLVSHEQWQRERQGHHRVPENHTLIKLRRVVDKYLKERAVGLRQIAKELDLRLAPEMLCRALFVQLMYSLPRTRSLYEQIDYNLLFRHFVGADRDADLCPYAEFERDVQALLRTGAVVDLADFVACQCVGFAYADMEFRFNHALLDAWRTLAAESARRPASAACVSQAPSQVPAVSPVAGSAPAMCRGTAGAVAA